MKKKILFILSTNYAGSHFLSLMLGSNRQAMHLGEVKRLRKPKKENARSACYICGDEAKCPLFCDINSDNVDDIYDIIFSRVDNNITTLVDTSKKTSWADKFISDERYEYKFIHLIRDPRSFVRRMVLLKTISESLHIRKQMALAKPAIAHYLAFCSKEMLYTYRWLKQNQDISNFLHKNKLRYDIVTYRDLALDQDNQLRRLTEGVGLTYSPSQVEYWKYPHHGTQKIEYQHVHSSNSKIFDVRWKDFLPEEVQKRIVGDKYIRKYLDAIGLDIVDDGLTRRE